MGASKISQSRIAFFITVNAKGFQPVSGFDCILGEVFVAAVVLEAPESLREFVGKEIGVSDWLTVRQDRIAKFAEATEDHQWIHLDTERAKKESPFKATIAHGFLTLSLISHLMKQAVQIRGVRLAINYGLNRVRFPSPVRAGSRIRGHFTLLALKSPSGAYEATFSVTIKSEGSEKPCCVAECVIRYYT